RCGERTTMSRGPGEIMQAIEKYLETLTADEMPTTLDLILVAYPGLEPKDIEKKHRVSVLRAAANVAKRMGWQPITITAITSSVMYVEGNHFKELWADKDGKAYLRQRAKSILLMKPPYVRMEPQFSEDTTKEAPEGIKLGTVHDIGD